MVCLYAFFFPQQCCDLGYHASLNRALRTFLSAELNLEQSKHEGLDAIENAVENLDATSDKQRLMEMYNNVFCPPMKFEFQPHMGDMVRPFPVLQLFPKGLECTSCMYSFITYRPHPMERGFLSGKLHSILSDPEVSLFDFE